MLQSIKIITHLTQIINHHILITFYFLWAYNLFYLKKKGQHIHWNVYSVIKGTAF